MLPSVQTRAVACALFAAATSFGASNAAPFVHDNRLQLALFASAPDIVTPIGIAADRDNRLFVLESHTHLQPPDYDGPRGDRVKVFTDADADGRPERSWIFAAGIEDGMNIAFSPGGEFYVVTSRAVWVLRDGDRDGVSESRTRILAMVKPDRVYDHAGLMGLAFSGDGWLYVSRGNTGGAAWRVQGTDATSVSGYGDGGSIIRCRPDGTSVQAVATGFWNPFALAFDPEGRLLATDNDPDSRGPNRLLHIVAAGDYGYKSLYGESGIHPYLAWNGELPGTLPYAAALGEAPSGFVHGALTALPSDYHDGVLVAIWEERRIVRVPLRKAGASLRGTASAVIEGNEQFRPVALAADGRGIVYISDWGLRQYPNHGKGRIWRLSARREAANPPRGGAPGITAADPLADVYTAGAAALARIREALLSDDPFMHAAAIARLSTPDLRSAAVDATKDSDPKVRVGAVVALQRAGYDDGEPLARRLLSDPDPLVRRMTLIWIGTAGMLPLRDALDAAIRFPPVTTELFETYLATVEQLSPEFIQAYRAQTQQYAKSLKRALPAGFLAAFIGDTTRPAALRALAIPYFADPAAESALLTRLARTDSETAVRLEAVRSLASVASADHFATLLELATSAQSPAELRAEAWLALTSQPPMEPPAAAIRALKDPDAHVRAEAGRYLRHARSSHRAAFDAAGRPASDTEWASAVADGGDPVTGRRVFFSRMAACSLCHRFERRGGELGPDLTNVGRSKTRAQILSSILVPSAEVSPEYQGWFVKTRNGEIHTGRQIDVGEGGRADLYVVEGKFVQLRDVVEYGPLSLSLMPENLEYGLTVTDMRDLLAFLTQAGSDRVR